MKYKKSVITFVFMYALVFSDVYAMDQESKSNTAESNYPNVATGLSIASSVIQIGLMFAPNIYRWYMTGSPFTDEYQQHKKVVLKQQEEANRIALSEKATNLCWANVAIVKQSLETIPEGEGKDAVLNSLRAMELDCSSVSAKHTQLLSEIPS